MADDAPTKPPYIVPKQTDGPFRRIWRELLEVPNLYTPCRILDLEPGQTTVMYRAPHENDVLLQADYGGGIQYSDESIGDVRLGMVYTDFRIPPLRFVCGELPTATMLKRMYWNPRLDAVSFNPNDPENRVETTGYILKREGAARLIGLVCAEDPFAYQANHMPQARQALAQDRIFETFHHASEAREEGDALDSVFPVEMHALMTLRLFRQAVEYREWYLDKSRRNTPASDLFTAWLLMLQGDAGDALGIIERYANDDAWGPMARWLGGQVMIGQGDLSAAIDWFNACLKMAPDHMMAALEKGVALRSLHWEPVNGEGLLEARTLLEKILPVTHFHRPQVLHHLGTICLALDDVDGLEKCTREALTIQNNPTVRRNLVLALLSKGQMEEAQYHYGLLKDYHPEDAGVLARHFGQTA